MNDISRDNLLKKLDEIEFNSDLRKNLDKFLDQYIHENDLEVVKSLLSVGADPNPENDIDCYLHYLLHEYTVTKTTKGNEILELARSLLKAGANPNRVWCNNWRAYDYAAQDHSLYSYSKILLEYGADPEIRDKV